jgi:hypothetical protein
VAAIERFGRVIADAAVILQVEAVPLGKPSADGQQDALVPARRKEPLRRALASARRRRTRARTQQPCVPGKLLHHRRERLPQTRPSRAPGRVRA